jgi:hypothetical protein
MTATTPSAVLVPVQPLFTDAERLALAGFLAGYRRPDPGRLRTGPAPVHHLVPRAVGAAVRGPARGHRNVRPRPGRPGPGPGYRDPAAVHDRRVLPVRGRGGTARAFPGRARPPPATGLGDCGFPRPPARTSSSWGWSAGTGPWSSPARAARSSPSRSHLAPPERSTWPSANAATAPSSSPVTGGD